MTTATTATRRGAVSWLPGFPWWGKTDGGTTGPVASTVVTDKPGGPDTRGATNQGSEGTVSTTKQPEVTVPLTVDQTRTWYDPLGLFTAAPYTIFNPVRFGADTATRLTEATKAFRAGKSTVPGHYGVLEMCGSLWTIASAERTAFLETYWKGITPTQANELADHDPDAALLLAQSQYEGAKTTRPYDWRSALSDVRYRVIEARMTELEKDNNDLRTQITALQTQFAEFQGTQSNTALKSALKPGRVAFKNPEQDSLADTSNGTRPGGTIGTNPTTTGAQSELFRTKALDRSGMLCMSISRPQLVNFLVPMVVVDGSNLRKCV